MCVPRFNKVVLSAVLLAVFAFGLCAISACQAPAGGQSGGATSFDRLVNAYPELKGGRFLIIADFEEPRHMELFQLNSVSSQARCVRSPNQGRRSTGRGCLSFISGSPNDAVVINNTYTKQWSLKRDWREYDLLLMSVESPAPGLALRLSVGSGVGQDRATAESSIPLARGWNHLRLDLAEIGEQVALDDVQEIRFAVQGASRTVELHIDDLLLAGNRTDLLGDSRHPESGLYVQRIGRRWRIGCGQSGGAFELTFANGQIVAWSNPLTDPHRLLNLVRGGRLGPYPVPPVTTPDGRPLVTRSRITEMNPVRVIVSSEWHIANNVEQATDALQNDPLLRWTYAIYATGQIYVSMERGESAASEIDGLGASVGVADSDDWKIVATAPSRGNVGSPAFGAARHSSANALVVFAPLAPRTVGQGDQSAVRVTHTFSDGSGAGRLEFVAKGLRTDSARRLYCHLFIGTATEITDEDVVRRARAYAAPSLLRVERGSLVSMEGDASSNTGFDYGSGSYVLTPDEGVVRFVVDPGQRTFLFDAFTIVNRERQDAWVYVNHVLHRPVVTNSQGDLLFQLRQHTDKPILVDVLFTQPAKTSGT